MSMKSNRPLLLTVCALSLFGLAACGGGDDKEEARYRITITNLTNNQPLSPPAVILHRSSYAAWQVGSAASTALERLAEGGDNSTLLGGLDDDIAIGASGSGAIAPGGSASIEIEADNRSQTLVTMATMLVNTNDAFTGVSGASVASLAKGDSIKVTGNVYDSGTEANSEAAADIPGPAGGGEGFNATRDDLLNTVRGHSGVVSADDGLAGSALNNSHRFDNPAISIEIRRI